VAAATLFARTSLVDRKVATTDILAVELLDSALAFLAGRHLDKAKALRPAGIAIRDHRGRIDRANLLEKFAKIFARGAVGKISHI